MPVLKVSGESDVVRSHTPVGIAQAESKVVLAALCESAITLADAVRSGLSNQYTIAQYVTLKEVVSVAKADIEQAELALAMVEAKVWEV